MLRHSIYQVCFFFFHLFIELDDFLLKTLLDETRGVSYISRLEAVQQAIEAQLIDLQQVI